MRGEYAALQRERDAGSSLHEGTRARMKTLRFLESVRDLGPLRLEEVIRIKQVAPMERMLGCGWPIVIVPNDCALFDFFARHNPVLWGDVLSERWLEKDICRGLNFMIGPIITSVRENLLSFMPSILTPASRQF